MKKMILVFAVLAGLGCHAQSDKYEAAMRQIPVSVLACSWYLTDEVRAAFRAMSQGRFWEMDTGHDLMISEPQKVADAFLEIAAQA